MMHNGHAVDHARPTNHGHAADPLPGPGRLGEPRWGRIAYDGTPTRLKSILFLVICATWLLPGLVGHDPWKVDEATAFGAVLEMLRTGDWVNFRIVGEPWLGQPPLYLWVAAIMVKLFGWAMPLHDAARLTSGLFMAATLAFLSLTCHELMGERAGRGGVLLFIGSVGLLARAHEMIAALAGLSGISMALYGFALSARRPAVGGAVAGCGMGIAFLGSGFLPLAMLVMTLGLLPLLAPFWRKRGYALTLLAVVACAAPFIALWLLLLDRVSGAMMHAWLAQATQTHWSDPSDDEGPLELLYFVRILPWYAWPALPLAAWTIWRTRRTLLARKAVLLPLIAFIAFLITSSAFGGPHEIDAIPLLLPLAILGIAELDSLPRGAAAAFDWFGMTTFFLFAALLWLAWAAALTGKPEFAAAFVRREVPNFHYAFSFLAVALAALLTLLWAVVVARSLRSTRRALVNWTAGITMVWMLAMTLGVPLIDQARSYRGVASRLVENLPPDFRCVARENVGDAQRALLDYFVNLKTIPVEFPAASRCRALLVQASPLHAPKVPHGWTEYWRGSRPGDSNELFILYDRAAPAETRG
ncbi:MAG TPA: glycosyltransferase family 39 protein [Usitatibacter sp.]|nr:glycosyltransferase family 39 protein [Usitatibacter sp.]